MNKDLIDFYNEEYRKVEKEIQELNEVNKKSPKRIARLVEIEYILDGLNASQELQRLRKENKQLKVQLLEKRCSDKDIEYKKRLKIENNWNKLKEYIKETKLKEFEKSYGKRYGKTFTQAEIIVCNMILDKMLELEGSDCNGNN